MRVNYSLDGDKW